MHNLFQGSLSFSSVLLSALNNKYVDTIRIFLQMVADLSKIRICWTILSVAGCELYMHPGFPGCFKNETIQKQVKQPAALPYGLHDAILLHLGPTLKKRPLSASTLEYHFPTVSR